MKELFREIKAAMGIYDPPATGGVHGLLAEFPNPGVLLDAAKAAREAGYRFYDTHSPFPIHGMDRAMGLPNSKVGLWTLVGGATGLGLATWMQWWMQAVDYPMSIGNKPAFAVEPSVPIMFELTVLLGALATALGMLVMNGLPRPYNPIFNSDRFARVTDDAFFLYLSASDPRFDERGAADFLSGVGATHVETIRDTDAATVPASKDVEPVSHPAEAA
ncbi:MAG TPA: DUF3341 domain-containing protein [Rhodothermales bacterium]|nr:DUF3341 domain-containing protein [Rhodothermales bacterium]